MRACTATTLSVVRYRDPVIRPSIDSMIFRNDFEKKATSTDNTNHPRGTVRLYFFYGCGIQRCEIRRSLEIKRSAIAGSRVFHSRPLLSLSLFFRVFLRCSAGWNRSFPVNLVSSNYRTILEYRLPFSYSFVTARSQQIAVVARWSEILNETRSCKSVRKSHIPDESRDGAWFFRSAGYGLRPTN